MENEELKRHLPYDIISTYILIHLSVKTLCRFRCVCKQWYSLISHPSFQEKHHQLGLQKSPQLLVTKFRFDRTTATSTVHLSTYTPTTDDTFLAASLRILLLPLSRFNPVRSCRGLICLGATTNRQILILNPSTHQLIALQPFQELSIQETAYFGFGYVSSTKEFKVVRFFRRYPDGNQPPENCCEVFTLGGAAGWREAKGPPHTLAPSYPPFFRGALHLIPDDHENFHSVTEHDSITVFDLESEEYITPIARPQLYHDVATVSGGAACVRLTEFGGTLCFTEHLLCGQGNMTFWLLKNSDKGEWAGPFVIDLSSLSSRVVDASPLACMGDGSFLLDVRLGEGRDFHSELLLYDAKEKKILQTIDHNCWGTLYVESLFTLQKR